MNETYQDQEPGYNATFYKNKESFILNYKPPSTADLIKQECDAVKHLLLEKNVKYGNSATSRGILFDIDPVTAIKARLNDKFSRWRNNNSDENEDVEKDIIGYIILLRIAKKQVS